MKFSRALHIFRRDLRIEDNTALNEARRRSETVLTCFIFDPRQVIDNPYRTLHGIQFMRESLEELGDEIRKRGGELRFFFGVASEVLPRILKDEGIDAVFINRDYTPFARNRDRALKEACDNTGVSIHLFGDALLNEPEAVQKPTGGPYTVFTPFWKRASAIPVRDPAEVEDRTFGTFRSASDAARVFAELPSFAPQKLFMHGGRKNALAVLEDIGKFRNYKEERDLPSRRGTTGLSAHLKFGTISPREAFRAIAAAHGGSHDLLRQLYWRDFFYHIAFHHPHVFSGSFHRQFDAVQWENDENLFRAWCRGETGFPIVDAGMRQMNETGYMHNRVRMITASFLVKDLHIDWRWGERYFAEQLTDYDPAVNNGSWQWAASTGCDAQPYFRIFNPWLQQERFDPEAEYIRTWVPELKNVPAKEIVNPEGARRGYPKPVVDHDERKIKAQRMFEEAAKKR